MFYHRGKSAKASKEMLTIQSMPSGDCSRSVRGQKSRLEALGIVIWELVEVDRFVWMWGEAREGAASVDSDAHG